MAYKDMIPDGDNEKYWENEWGSRYWLSKTKPHLYAHRSYYWVDRVSFIDESHKNKWGDRERRHVGGEKFSEFIFKEKDWIICDKKFYRKQKLEELKKKL